VNIERAYKMSPWNVVKFTCYDVLRARLYNSVTQKKARLVFWVFMPIRDVPVYWCNLLII